MRKFLSILLVLFSFVAVEAQPIGEGCAVDFTASVDNLELYLNGNATLEDSTEAVTWSWDIGELGSIIDVDLNSQSVVVVALPGVYTICLTITTSTGCSAMSCQDVVVEQDGFGGGDSTDCFMWASFFMTTSGTTATFNDISFNGNNPDGINSWAWDFGDDNTSTDQNPIHTYTAEGVYTVCLTVTNDDECTSTNCQDVNVGDVAIDCTTITNGTSPYGADDSIFLQVIAADSFCCTGNWDGVCQSLYDEIAGNGNGGIDTTDCVTIINGTSPYSSDDPIFLQVIEEDNYCCTGAWDGICQGLYDEIAGNGGGDSTDCFIWATFFMTTSGTTATFNDISFNGNDDDDGINSWA
ncbi:MAG: PKD domain-containing protein [Chitinophagales bacterium]